MQPVTVQQRMGKTVPLFHTCMQGSKQAKSRVSLHTRKMISPFRASTRVGSGRPWKMMSPFRRLPLLPPGLLPGRMGRTAEYLHHVSFGLRWAEPYWCCYMGYLNGRPNCLFMVFSVDAWWPGLDRRYLYESRWNMNNADTRSLIYYAMF